jgi:kynureninase
LFVRRDLQEAVANPIQGWFGQRNPFEFGLSYEPAAGIERYQVGTAPMLSVIGCEAGIALVEEVGISAIRARSLEQTQRLIDGLGDVPGSRILTPRDADRRGAHVTLGHPEAWRIVRCLIEDENIIPDFRAPDGIRLGPAPLYTTDEEMDRAIAAIHDIVRTERYLKFDANRPSVT